jgi:hypothetical protein
MSDLVARLLEIAGEMEDDEGPSRESRELQKAADEIERLMQAKTVWENCVVLREAEIKWLRTALDQAHLSIAELQGAQITREALKVEQGP